MKRFHVHVSVQDLQESIRFYSTLFAAEPSVVKPDYAKWMLEDPRVNFAISQRGTAAGIDHLGFQVEHREELAPIAERLDAAGREVFDRGEAHCCYAHSDKAWVADPQGIKWETFFTFGAETAYGEDSSTANRGEPARACCGIGDAVSEPSPARDARPAGPACCAA